MEVALQNKKSFNSTVEDLQYLCNQPFIALRDKINKENPQLNEEELNNLLCRSFCSYLSNIEKKHSGLLRNVFNQLTWTNFDELHEFPSLPYCRYWNRIHMFPKVVPPDDQHPNKKKHPQRGSLLQGQQPIIINSSKKRKVLFHKMTEEEKKVKDKWRKRLRSLEKQLGVQKKEIEHKIEAIKKYYINLQKVDTWEAVTFEQDTSAPRMKIKDIINQYFDNKLL